MITNSTTDELIGGPPGREQDRQSLRDARLGLLVQGVTDYAIFMLDSGGRVVCWNTGAERVFGYPDQEVVDEHYARFFTPEDVAAGEPGRELRVAAAEGRYEAEGWRVRRDGAQFRANVVITAIRGAGPGKLVGYAQVTRDVTDRRRLEDRLRHADKMEAIGALAAGVAHDFNNMLTVINGYGEALLGDLPPGDRAREAVHRIVHAGRRAAALTHQLLGFSRQQPLAPEVLDMNVAMAAFEPLLRRLAGASVDVTVAPAAGPQYVEADPAQVEQVLLNLTVNARDAMPHGGRLAFRMAAAEIGGPGRPIPPDVRPGPYVTLAVSDTGVGMDEATAARVFDPFFTTKSTGHGTGLGLSSVYGFVKQSGGHVEVASRPGAGTTFTVYLPAAGGPPPAATPPPSAPVVRGGGETVLLVEDEEDIRALGRHALGTAGYVVLEAADGGSALDVAAGHPGPIHLLVTDVIMPGVGGPQLASQLCPLRSGMKVLYVSGYSGESVPLHGAYGMKVPFLQKPFTPRELAGKVRETLDG